MRSHLVAALALAVMVAAMSAPHARADYIDHFANPDDIGVLKIPREGLTNVLVIPVIVDNLPFEQGSEQAFLDELDAFFDPAATGWAFTPYWRTMSLGRFEPHATVAAPVRFPSCPQLGAYEDCEIPRGAGIATDPQGALAVLDDSFTFLDEIFRCASVGPANGLRCTEGGGVSFPAFDTSGAVAGTPDTIVDGVIVVSNAGFPGIALPIKDLSTSPLLQFVGPFPDFTYDGVTVGAVAIAGRASLPQRAAWVSVHELGHLLGFADLYDESGNTNDMPYTLMGGWFYADPGSLLDAYSRIAAGWGHVVQVTSSGTFEVGPADQRGTVLKVGTGTEFFLVELRRKVDGVLDGDMTVDFGVVVERVRLEERPDGERGNYLETLQECVNCRLFDTFLSIEQADGNHDLEYGRGRDDEDDLFQAGGEIGPSDNTEPRSRENSIFSTNLLDGTPTGITIRVVEASATKAVIEIETPDVADGCVQIAEWCGDFECEDIEGAVQCGEVPPPPTEVIPPPEGCTCASTSTWAPLGVALLALVRRSRRPAATPSRLAGPPLGR